jgi:hypothetical protein
MDFVERWLGFSPDGGNGSFEALFIVVPVILVMLAVVIYRRSR